MTPREYRAYILAAVLAGPTVRVVGGISGRDRDEMCVRSGDPVACTGVCRQVNSGRPVSGR